MIRSRITGPFNQSQNELSFRSPLFNPDLETLHQLRGFRNYICDKNGVTFKFDIPSMN